MLDVGNISVLLQYILLLRNLGELDKVCEARQCMSNYHALSPEMWKEWIDDAMSLKHRFSHYAFLFCLPSYISVHLSGFLSHLLCSEMFDVIENLYERAVQEYQV